MPDRLTRVDDLHQRIRTRRHANDQLAGLSDDLPGMPSNLEPQ